MNNGSNDQTDTPPILVTGGAGFIGSNFVRYWLSHCPDSVINVDKLTYAGNLNSLEALRGEPRHVFIRGDIGDATLIRNALRRYAPRAVINFAAESHVDRSIHAPGEFIETNVMGTFRLLDEIREYWESMPPEGKSDFRFLHVSTDEVYGSLGENDPPFSERSAYAPNSPYAASKAAADHLVRAYHHTYKLPTLTTNCSNNYGPFQFPEKLIPLLILNALEGKPLPVYGDGGNVRDWIYVEDHCDAVCRVLEHGRAGETYNVGGNEERTNLSVVKAVCSVLDELRPRPSGVSYETLITFVVDRPGHDRRYAIDATKIARELQWRPKTRFEDGLRATVRWYLTNDEWVAQVRNGEYRKWIELNYGARALV